MKKRAIMISMLLVMALSVTGCSQKTATKDKDTKTEETAKTDDAEETESDNTEDTSEDTPTTAELMAGIDVEKCVTLGDYKGVTVEKTIQSVTDEDVQNEIDNALANYPVEVDQAAKEGDTVNIDYVGKIDGEEFDGGSDQGADRCKKRGDPYAESDFPGRLYTGSCRKSCRIYRYSQRGERAVKRAYGSVGGRQYRRI